MLKRHAGDVAAQPLDHKMLEIVDVLAKLARRRTQQAQRLGMAVEKVGMIAEIGYDIAAADFLRRWFGQSAVALGPRLVARAVNHGRLSPPCERASGDVRAMRILA